MHFLRTYLLQALGGPAPRDVAGPEALVGAETYATRRWLLAPVPVVSEISRRRPYVAKRVSLPGWVRIHGGL
jgi:hypothetical protein